MDNLAPTLLAPRWHPPPLGCFGPRAPPPPALMAPLDPDPDALPSPLASCSRHCSLAAIHPEPDQDLVADAPTANVACDATAGGPPTAPGAHAAGTLLLYPDAPTTPT
jgi:hypothetical protein